MSNIFFKKVKTLNNKKNLKINNNKNKGYFRQFPPANIEWSNSVYAYNKNYIKYLPTFDKMVVNIIKSYFGLYNVKNKIRKFRPRRIRIRLKRLSTNRIFVSKAEIKHTNTKAIITLYIYNAEKRYLLNKLNKLKYIDYSLYNKKNILKKNEKLYPKLYYKNLLNIKLKTLNIKKLIKSYFYFYIKYEYLINISKSINNKEKNIYKYFLMQQYETVIKSFIRKSLKKEKLIIYYNSLLWFNKSKFENTYLYPLNKVIKNFYNKKIEFNLVNLKYLHLNSNIFTESIAIKLKNRKNRLSKVLRLCLKKVKLPVFNKNSEMFSYIDKWERKELSIFNNVESLKLINKLSALEEYKNNNIHQNKDFLDQYLQQFFLQKKHNKEII